MTFTTRVSLNTRNTLLSLRAVVVYGVANLDHLLSRTGLYMDEIKK